MGDTNSTLTCDFRCGDNLLVKDVHKERIITPFKFRYSSSAFHCLTLLLLPFITAAKQPPTVEGEDSQFHNNITQTVVRILPLQKQTEQCNSTALSNEEWQSHNIRQKLTATVDEEGKRILMGTTLPLMCQPHMH